MKNTDIEREKWNKQKALGKKKFVLIYGVLVNACISLVFATFHVMVFNRTLLKSMQSILLIYFMYIVGWGLLGIVTGNLWWKGNEKIFGK